MMSPFATVNGGEPYITNVTHNPNFITEIETNLNCQEIIDYFHYINDNGLTVKRNTERGAKDTQAYVHELPYEYFHDNLSRRVYQRWNYLTDQALREYANKYDILMGRRFQHTLCKLQKTSPGEGYHAWHYESTPSSPYRKLVTMIYLNDNFEGGETEFLYQHFRVKPKAGKFVIFPCDWAWTHRGNPPLNNDKYIVTAWVEEYPTPGQ